MESALLTVIISVRCVSLAAVEGSRRDNIPEQQAVVPCKCRRTIRQLQTGYWTHTHRTSWPTDL